MDLSFTPEQNEIVVRHLYGFDFMDDWKTEIPTKLHDFLVSVPSHHDTRSAVFWMRRLQLPIAP